MSKIDFNALRDRAYKCACDHGFHNTELSNGHLLMLVITELSEAVEADRKGRFHYIKKFSNEKETIEKWIPVKKYEQYYEVSNLGRVRSKDMLVWNGHSYHLKKGRILKPGLGGTGYYTVSLKGRTHKVAVLVANAFLDKISDTDFVNHIDGNKTNDNINNLEFVSPSQNSRHAYISGLHSSKSYQKLTYEQKCEISFLHKLGIAYTTIYKHNTYGVTKSAIQRICNDYTKYTDSVEFELADAVIRLLELAGLIDISLEDIYDFMKEPEYKDWDDALKEMSFTERMFFLTSILTEDRDIAEVIKASIVVIFLNADLLYIDLLWHIEQKQRYNELRENKHGKRY
jgi:hypothetical protein|nr:MAG TPA: homing endonuclease [Caudoviricetes sp.]